MTEEQINVLRDVPNLPRSLNAQSYCHSLPNSMFASRGIKKRFAVPHIKVRYNVEEHLSFYFELTTSLLAHDVKVSVHERSSKERQVHSPRELIMRSCSAEGRRKWKRSEEWYIKMLRV